MKLSNERAKEIPIYENNKIIGYRQYTKGKFFNFLSFWGYRWN